MNRMTGSGPDLTNASKKKQGEREHHDFQNVSHRFNDCSCQLFA